MEFFAKDGAIYQGDLRAHIKGVNWFGMETEVYAFHGLWAVSMMFVLDFLVQNKFNAVRVPFSAELALGLDTLKCTSINTFANPDFADCTPGRLLDAFVRECEKRGIIVMLDMHRLKGNGGITELWYDATYTEETIIRAWRVMAARYANSPAVFAADLKNEPHGSATWSSGNAQTDWNKAAERIGNAVLSVNPRLLIFVEGVETHKGVGSWWGGNLMGVRDAPINLARPNKLVYSPHVYGPSVYAQPYFSDGAFPANLPAIWNNHWAFLKRENLGAVCVGEWGGWMRSDNRDDVWHNAFAAFLRAQEIDYFYWCLNPNSGDTGGLLGDDWKTPVAAKLRLLDTVSPNPTKFSFSRPSVVASPPKPPPPPPPPASSPLPPPPRAMSPQPPPFNPPSPAGASPISVRAMSSGDWMSNGIQFYKQDVEIMNMSPKTVTEVQLFVDCDVLEQAWNCVRAGKTISFPAWAIQQGLRPGEKLVMGYIVSGKRPNVRIVKTI
jgi:endoglucanase